MHQKCYLHPIWRAGHPDDMPQAYHSDERMKHLHPGSKAAKNKQSKKVNVTKNVSEAPNKIKTNEIFVPDNVCANKRSTSRWR